MCATKHRRVLLHTAAHMKTHCSTYETLVSLRDVLTDESHVYLHTHVYMCVYFFFSCMYIYKGDMDVRYETLSSLRDILVGEEGSSVMLRCIYLYLYQ